MKINQALLEEVLRIKVNILLTGDSSRLKSIMVTSANHGEGTSSVATYLAVAFALGDKSRVLLVDANIRRPSLHTLFGLERESGFLDFIGRKADLAQSIKKTSFSNIKLMTAGQPLDYRIPTLFSIIPQDAKKFIEKNFDWVLYDTAPVNAYPDTLIEATLADGIILVVRAEKTRLAALKSAKESLEAIEPHILGGVLNGRRYFIPKFIYERL